jgi:hypothetical protein
MSEQQELTSYSVNSVNFKYTFEDSHTCFLSKGKSKEAQARYEDAISDLVADHGNITSEIVISYLAWDKDAVKGSDSIRLKANAFGRQVEPGHSFKGTMSDTFTNDKGVIVPVKFSVFRRTPEVMSYKALQAKLKAEATTEEASDEAPYSGDSA